MMYDVPEREIRLVNALAGALSSPLEFNSSVLLVYRPRSRLADATCPLPTSRGILDADTHADADAELSP